MLYQRLRRFLDDKDIPYGRFGLWFENSSGFVHTLRHGRELGRDKLDKIEDFLKHYPAPKFPDLSCPKGGQRRRTALPPVRPR